MSERDGGEHCVKEKGQEGSDNASKEWGSESTGDSKGSATEAEATNAGGSEWGRATWTTIACSTQECVAKKMHGDAWANGGKNRKSPSTAAEKEGAWGHHGARPA